MMDVLRIFEASGDDISVYYICIRKVITLNIHYSYNKILAFIFISII